MSGIADGPAAQSGTTTSCGLCAPALGPVLGESEHWRLILNYAFLQNQDRHVHPHVIPRYAADRELRGLTFTDPDCPDHYAVPGPVRHLAGEHLGLLTESLRAALDQAGTCPVEPGPSGYR